MVIAPESVKVVSTNITDLKTTKNWILLLLNDRRSLGKPQLPISGCSLFLKKITGKRNQKNSHFAIFQEKMSYFIT